jgi:uncharacterized protein (DUF1015 family)
MATIRPFRGLRPKPEFAARVAAPPYDVLSSDEARALVKDNPDSFLRVNKSEVDFDPNTNLYGEEIYRRGRENLERLMADEIMVREEKESLYLYRLTWRGSSQTGLVALSSVAEYDAGLIKKHEHTRPKKVNDRATHIQTLKAQVGPVFSTFRSNESIESLFANLTARDADIDFVADDSVRHELWIISDERNVAALIESFGALDALYIADGHHRSQSASEVCRRMKEENPAHTGDEVYNFFLNVLFPDQQLRILSYNRVVADLGSLSVSEILERAATSYEIVKSDSAVAPETHGEIGIYVDGTWYKATAKEGSYDASDPVGSIDATILTRNFLTPILGIEDLRTDERIDFVGGIRGTAELQNLVDSNQMWIAFSVPPVSVEQLLNVADAGEVMPPKSTWFEPKLRSGLVVNLLDG